jgi:hypothetical protein
MLNEIVTEYSYLCMCMWGGGVDRCNICHSLRALGKGMLLVMYFAYKFGEHILY